MRSVAKPIAGITTKNDRIDPRVVGTPHRHVFVKTTWVLRTWYFSYLWNLISHLDDQGAEPWIVMVQSM